MASLAPSGDKHLIGSGTKAAFSAQGWQATSRHSYLMPPVSATPTPPPHSKQPKSPVCNRQIAFDCQLDNLRKPNSVGDLYPKKQTGVLADYRLA